MQMTWQWFAREFVILSIDLTLAKKKLPMKQADYGRKMAGQMTQWKNGLKNIIAPHTQNDCRY